MWDTVLLMGVAAGLGPQRLATVVFLLSRAQPIRLLFAFLLAGLGMTLVVGSVILFVLEEAGVGASSAVPAEIEIAVGVLALLVAVLIGSGLPVRIRDRFQTRHSEERGKPAASSPMSGGRPGLEQFPGYKWMPRRVQRALERESPWIGWVAGIAVGLPNLYLLAAIAAVLYAGVETSTQLTALVIFSFVAFTQTMIPLVSLLLAPDATREIADRFYAWLNAHQRPRWESNLHRIAARKKLMPRRARGSIRSPCWRTCSTFRSVVHCMHCRAVRAVDRRQTSTLPRR